MTPYELITAHAHLPKVIARRLMGRAPSLEQFEDAVGAGTIALCEAARSFDASRGATFATYAWTAIERAVVRYRRQHGRIFEHETLALNAASCGGDETHSGNALLDVVNMHRNEHADSAEELLVQAEERARGEARLARLSPENRARVERLLNGESMGARNHVPVWKTLAREAGVRVSGRDVPPEHTPMTRAERQKRYEQRAGAALRERKNAAARAKRAAARAVRA